ncbi:ArsC/Spx/MgsR family protein, partial [Bacillus thuringiensis]|uniref:ArsC/Spx/MgsR family protein n=1 Tax=Bacillus thuringiensis TaxID=1428 RepID=UPI00119DE7D5
ASLEEHQIHYIQKNILSNSITLHQLKSILPLTQQPPTQIISTTSKTFHHLNINIHDLSLNQFYTLIIHHPLILPRPIILDHKRFQIPFNHQEI